MAISKSDLVKQAKIDNSVIGKSNGRMQNEINRLLRSYKHQIEALIRNDSLFTDANKFDLALAGKTLSDLEAILKREQPELLNTFFEQFAPLTIEARKYFEQFGDVPNIGGSSAHAFDTFIKIREERLVQTIDTQFLQPIQDGIFYATFGTMPRSTVVDTIISLADDLTERQVVTMVDDSFREYQRSVTNTTGEELGLEVWWYQGPDDDITSDQCDFILNDDPHGVPGMYYRDEISIDMHPKLRDDPFIAGGHPNCRHKFYPIPLDYAQERGFK